MSADGEPLDIAAIRAWAESQCDRLDSETASDAIRDLCDAIEALRAENAAPHRQVAEVEAERDRADERWAEWFHRGTKAEAKLAAVEKVLTEYGDAGDVGALAELVRAEVCPPHRYPASIEDDVIAWKCAECGEVQRD